MDEPGLDDLLEGGEDGGLVEEHHHAGEALHGQQHQHQAHKLTQNIMGGDKQMLRKSLYYEFLFADGSLLTRRLNNLKSGHLSTTCVYLHKTGCLKLFETTWQLGLGIDANNFILSGL